MRALPLFALVLAAACAAPPPTPEGEPIEERGFDTAEWVAAVRDAPTATDRRALASRLLDAVDWRTACGEDDPTNPGRGTLAVYPYEGAVVDPEARTVADVTCQRREGVRVFALVDLEPGRAPRLVRALGISEAGQPTDEPVPGFYGAPTYAPDGARRFELLTPNMPAGGCGLFVRYALADDGGAAIEEVRLYDGCDAPLPVDEWPVTYEAP